MNFRYNWLVLPLTILLFNASCSDNKTDKKNISLLYRKYAQAINDVNGPAALQCIDSNTVNYYSLLMHLIKNEDSIGIAELRFDQKMIVLGIRHLLPKERIYKMSGKGLFLYCVKTGLFDGSDLRNKFFKKITIKENLAVGDWADSSGKISIPLEIRKEHGFWKLDLTSIAGNISKDAWKEYISAHGATEHELLNKTLTSMNGVPPNDSIWHKP